MRQHILFKNDKKIRLNDVFSPNIPYDLQPVKYQFVLKPNCDYWRFGIIFTNEKEIPDPGSTNFDRYRFTINQYLQVNVGILPSEYERTNPDFFQITDMQVPPFTETSGFRPRSAVTLTFQWNQSNNTVNYQCEAIVGGGPTTFSGELPLRFNEFLYLAVWADYNQFELECDLTVFDDEEVNASSRTSQSANPENFVTGTSDEYSVKDDVDPTLDVDIIAEEVAKLTTRIPSQHGTVLGIFGKWGRGKTYLMNRIWNAILNTQAIKIKHRVNFHAWKYQDSSAIWGYLYEQFSEQYFKLQKYKMWAALQLNLKRLGCQKIILFLIRLSLSLGFTFLSFHLKFQLLGYLLSTFSVLQIFSLVLLFRRYSPSAKTLYNTYFTRPSFVKLMGVQAEMQKELQTLLEVWAKDLKGEKIALFVDDIDRCPETLIIQTVDALRVMVEDHEIAKYLVVIVSMDDRILRRAIQLKYRALMEPPMGTKTETQSDNEKQQDLANKDKGALADLVNEYFDKLFIVGVKLGELSAIERISFFRELIKDNLNKPQQENPKAASGESKQANQNDEAKSNSNQALDPGTDQKLDDLAVPEIISIILSEKEAEFFQRAFQDTDGFTPRQIKIIYYRYLLARSLLNRIHDRLGVESVWRQAFYCEIMIKLIVKYSENKNQLMLSEHRTNTNKSNSAETNIYFFERESILTEHYKSLLNILDIVIAY